MTDEFRGLPVWLKLSLIDLSREALAEAKRRIEEGDGRMPGDGELSDFVNDHFRQPVPGVVSDDWDDSKVREAVQMVYERGADHFDPDRRPDDVLAEYAETVVWNHWNRWLTPPYM